MLERDETRAGPPKVLIIGIAICFVMASWLTFNYRSYLYAITWHCMHGNETYVGKYRVKLPILWRPQAANSYGTYILTRASDQKVLSQITISPVQPAVSRNTDQAEQNAIQALVDSGASNKNLGPKSSMIIIHPKAFTMYCQKTEFLVPGLTVNSRLYCLAANTPVVWTYNGSPAWEREAKSILASLS